MGSFEIGQMNTSSVLVSSDNTLTILFGVLAVVFFIVMVVFISLWRVEVKKSKIYIYYCYKNISSFEIPDYRMP